jgi:hypothetical protein
MIQCPKLATKVHRVVKTTVEMALDNIFIIFKEIAMITL